MACYPIFQGATTFPREWEKRQFSNFSVVVKSQPLWTDFSTILIYYFQTLNLMNVIAYNKDVECIVIDTGMKVLNWFILVGS